MEILLLAKPHLGQTGGAQATTDLLARELQRRGHGVRVLCPVDTRWGADAFPAGEDDRAGYVTHTAADVGAAAHAELARAEVVLAGACDPWANAELAPARAAAEAALPCALYLHDPAAAPVAAASRARLVAVSRFVAGLVGRATAVILPMVPLERYRVPTSRRRVLFVNPHPQKGLETAHALARARPEIPFTFAPSWRLDAGGTAAARAAAALPNVLLAPRAASPAELYGEARVLLVPSPYPEGYGRVAREAQASGIPVIASRVGGLPEAVGDGGLLVAPDAGLTGWAAALDRVWADPAPWEEAARRQGEDPACGAAAVGDAWEELLAGLVVGA